MKSDVVRVTNAGKGIEEALEAASASARYRELGKKEALHLRLLAEEMLGMVRQITGDAEAEFWTESEGKSFRLCLTARPIVTDAMRKQLIGTATSGKNEAAQGFMGKIRDIIDRAFLSDKLGDLPDSYMRGVVVTSDIGADDLMTYSLTANMISWSMRNYKAATEKERDDSEEAQNEWDELEKSIVANIADEVKIAITGNDVELTVYKDFKN